MPVMPDTRIALSGLSTEDRSQSSSPFQTLGAMMKIKEDQQLYKQREMEAEKRRRLLEDDDATTAALQRFDRPEEAIDHLWKTGRSSAAAGLAKDVYGQRTELLKAQDAELKSHGERLGLAAQMLGSATDDASYQTIRPQVAKIVEPIYGATVNDYLPTTYDKPKVDQLRNAGLTRKEQIDVSRGIIKDAQAAYTAGLIPASAAWAADPDHVPSAADKDVSPWSPNGMEAQEKHQELLARSLTTAQNKDQWDAVLKLAYDRGVPQVVISKFGPWNANAQERARDLGLNLPQRAAAETAASRAETYGDTAADAALRRQEAADRREEADQRRREAAAAKAQADADRASGKITSPEGRAREEDAIQKEYDKADELLPVDADLKTLPDDTKQAYIKARVTAENKNRRRLQGLDPIDQAAKAAVAKGDRTGYDKLTDVYKNITQGLGSLEDLVPWPDKNAGVVTPEAQAQRRKDIVTILGKLKDPTLTPAARKALELQRNQLLNATR